MKGRFSLMAASTRQAQARELHANIWKLANELRGQVGASIGGWEFKIYVLGTLFYKYLSEHLTYKLNWDENNGITPETDGLSEEEIEALFDFTKQTDDFVNDTAKLDIVSTYGFYIPPSYLFCNVVKEASKDATGLCNKVTDIFKFIEESTLTNEVSSQAFRGIFTDYKQAFQKLGKDNDSRDANLFKVLNTINGLNLGLSNSSIDAFGDAYEYLIGMYAANAGKSGGEYFTPQEVSELLVHLSMHGKTKVNKIYDPTCGSGSLLLKATKLVGIDDIEYGFFGQELNETTKNLAVMNMILHGVPLDKIHIACDDTLTKPHFDNDKPFDVIVSNPPYSVKWKGSDDVLLAQDWRFVPAGVLAPKSKADFAFIMHSLAYLSPVGTASIVCFPGILYRKGAEQKIRKYLVYNNYIDTIIQLPANLFYGTSIATCIMVLKKNKADNTIQFIDASNEFVKATNSNLLSEENSKSILDWFINRKDVAHRVSVVSNKKVEEEGYNLTVSTYVEKEDTREKIDIKELNRQLDEIVKRENELRAEIAKIIQDLEED